MSKLNKSPPALLTPPRPTLDVILPAMIQPHPPPGCPPSLRSHVGALRIGDAGRLQLAPAHAITQKKSPQARLWADSALVEHSYKFSAKRQELPI